MKTCKPSKGCYSSRFFGFPVSIYVNRKSPLTCNYCDVKFTFWENTDGEEIINEVKRAINKNLFVRNEDICVTINNKNEPTITFKYVMPYVADRKSKNMSNKISDGIAACLFNQIITYKDKKYD